MERLKTQDSDWFQTMDVYLTVLKEKKNPHKTKQQTSTT